MNNSHQRQQPNEQYNPTMVDELRQYVAKFFRSLHEWMRPNKDQPRFVQVVLFLLKLPVVLLVLVLTLGLSPVVLVVLILVFIAAI
jgi:hypothetical protein